MTTSVVHLSEKELKAAVGSLKGSKKAVAREVLRRRREESREGWLRWFDSVDPRCSCGGRSAAARKKTNK